MIRCAWNQLELRLGGIYVLERSAQESEKDHWPIMEVLTTYVREHAPIRRTIKTKKTEIISAPRADIPTILTVIGRRGRTFKKGEDERLYLFRTDLVEANLTFAHLEGAGRKPKDVFRPECFVSKFARYLHTPRAWQKAADCSQRRLSFLRIGEP